MVKSRLYASSWLACRKVGPGCGFNAAILVVTLLLLCGCGTFNPAQRPRTVPHPSQPALAANPPEQIKPSEQASVQQGTLPGDFVVESRPGIADPQADFFAYANQVLTGAEGEATIAAFNPKTGKTIRYGPDRTYIAASVIKLLILATLFLQVQDIDGLDEEQTDLAEHMIIASDNDAAHMLYEQIGEAAGLKAGALRFGMKRTIPAAQVGLTTTTVEDQLLLLKALTAKNSALKPTSQRYILGLMGRVNADQDWGVGDAGATAKLKDGWLPLENENNSWGLNSVGIVQTAQGDPIHIAILSHGWSSYPADTKWIAKLAQAATSVLAPG